MKLSSDSSRVAVYHNEVHYISKYLMDLDLNLVNYLPWFFKWGKSDEILNRAGVDRGELEQLNDSHDERLYGICDQIWEEAFNEEKRAFVKFIAWNHPTEAPAWGLMVLMNKRLPRNTWLVHFSDQTGRIVEEGFTRGVGDMERLALTTHIHENVKKYGGYNFAFIAGDRDCQQAARSGRYGGSAVMFQASGLEIYHYGDQESQVIFWGKAIDPRSTVELVEKGDGWAVRPRNNSSMIKKGRNTVYQGDFSRVVRWVEKNWIQYQGQIMGR